MALKTYDTVAKLVFSTQSFPLEHFINAPVHSIRLRGLSGRQRHVPCFNGAVSRRARAARMTKSAASKASRPSTSSTTATAALKGGSCSKSNRASKERYRRVTAFPKNVRETEPDGLHNPHNYCYRRSILQCLLQIPSLYVHVANTHKRCDNDKRTCVPCALKAFFYAYWRDRTFENFPDGEGGAVDKLDRVLNESFELATDNTYTEIMQTDNQCDAAEYLLLLSNKLYGQAPATREALDRLFELEFETTWECVDCGEKTVWNASNSDEARNTGLTFPVAEFDDYGRPVQGQRDLSLDDLFDDYCKEEHEIRCESDMCEASRQIDEELGGDGSGTSKNREKVRKIARAPEILMINFRRNHQDPVSGRNYKLRNDVDYPEFLHLSKRTVNERRLEYRLAGVAAHAGRRVDLGHWVAVVRAKAGGGYHTVSDMVCYEKEQDFDEIRYPNIGNTEFDTAVLVYVKVAGT